MGHGCPIVIALNGGFERSKRAAATSSGHGPGSPHTHGAVLARHSELAGISGSRCLDCRIGGVTGTTASAGFLH